MGCKIYLVVRGAVFSMSGIRNFLKGTGAQKSGFCRQYYLCLLVCVAVATLPLWHKSSHRHYVNKWAWLCSSKTLFIKTIITDDLSY